MHIRNGDFINVPHINSFNRIDYLTKAIEEQERIKKHKVVVVFSDDISLCKREYDALLKENFDEVEYHETNSLLQDFVDLSMFKDKILWNSTFSYWTGFISDVIYEDKGTIVVPDTFMRDVPASSRINPRWTMIETVPNN